jgi:hypothetical protein
MKASLALTIILYASGLAAWTAVQVFRRRASSNLLTAALVVLELGLLLQAVIDLFSLMGGHRPRELAIHVAYLVTSVAVLPIVVPIGRKGRKAPAMTDAVVCAAVVIIVARLQMTGTV